MVKCGQMDTPTLTITFLPAPDDPPLKTPEYQAELRSFEQTLTSNGIEVSDYAVALRQAWSPDPVLVTYLGDFTIKLASKIGPPLITGIAAWLHGRGGRKVRLKSGDIEAEAPTVKEVQTLIAQAQESQQRKLIL